MKYFYFFCCAAFLFSSCGEPAPIINETIVERFIPITLTNSDVFENNKVQAFLKNEVKYHKEANALFLSGVDSYRNKKQLDSAEVYFRKALMKEPSSKAYFELGNLLMDRENYEEALRSFDMAEKLNYEPFSKILYNKACIYSLQKETKLSSQYIEYAIQAGYSNIDHLNKDSDLENVRNYYDFKNSIKKGLSGTSGNENLYWLKFKKQFSIKPLPDTLLTKHGYEDLESFGSISYDYEKYIAEMRDEMFSREVGKMFYHYSLPYETDKYVAVIYIVQDQFLGETAPELYRLATFTHDGKLIDKKVISGMDNLDGPLKKGVVLENGVLEVSTFDIKYEKDTDKYGYYENPVVNEQLIGTSVFEISESGKIQSSDMVEELTVDLN